MKKRKATVAAVSALPVIRPLVAGVDVGSREHWVAGPQQDPNTPNVRVFLTTTSGASELGLGGKLSEEDVRRLARHLREQLGYPVR